MMVKEEIKTYLFKIIVEPDEDIRLQCRNPYDGNPSSVRFSKTANKDRWIAYCPILKDKGGATWGYTKEEALKNIREVIQMTIESMIEHGEKILGQPEGERNLGGERDGKTISIGVF